MAIDREDFIAAAKGAQWQIAKGHLRAFLAIAGQTVSIYDGPTGAKAPSKFDALSPLVENFIHAVEDQGLHE